MHASMLTNVIVAQSSLTEFALSLTGVAASFKEIMLGIGKDLSYTAAQKRAANTVDDIRRAGGSARLCPELLEVAGFGNSGTTKRIIARDAQRFCKRRRWAEGWWRL